MTSHVRSPVSAPGWGAARFPEPRRRGLHDGAAGGALLLAIWILLWSFFTLAVLEPAARLHGGQTPAVTERA